MRVLHFCEAFSLLSETFIYDSYVGQVQDGLDAHMVTVRRVDEATRPAAHVHLLHVPPRAHPRRIFAQLQGRLQRLPRWERPFPLYARGLRDAIDRLKPDVVHAHFGTAGVIAERACRGVSVPLVVTMYGHDISRLPREARWRARYEKLFARASLVTVLSENMRDAARRLGVSSQHIEVVHLARAFEALPFRARAGNVQKWLTIGRLIEKKGIDDAIRAVALLRERGIAAELEVIGDGPLLSALVRLVTELGLEGAVRFSGAQPNQRALQALEAADAFVLCSKSAANGDQEGTPTVLVEAQALGVPCVSTRHAGIPEMFAETAHWVLAREGSVAEIAERMERVTRLSLEARGELVRAGREHVEQGFSLGAQTRRYTSLYERVSAGGRAAR